MLWACGRQHNSHCTQWNLSFTAKPTQDTNAIIIMLLNYLNTYLKAKVHYTASDIILYVHVYAVYLVVPKAHSRATCYIYCRDKYEKNTAPRSKLNGPVHIKCKTLKHVVEQKPRSLLYITIM